MSGGIARGAVRRGLGIGAGLMLALGLAVVPAAPGFGAGEAVAEGKDEGGAKTRPARARGAPLPAFGEEGDDGPRFGRALDTGERGVRRLGRPEQAGPDDGEPAADVVADRGVRRLGPPARAGQDAAQGDGEEPGPSFRAARRDGEAGQGALRSEMKGLNAAHGGGMKFIKASDESQVGRIRIHRDAVEAEEEAGDPDAAPLLEEARDGPVTKRAGEETDRLLGVD